MDANATTPLLPEVMEAMRPYWMEHFGNASSIHLHGQQARTAVDRARETMAEFFNCHDAEVVFNSGGTEGDNTAIFGLLHPSRPSPAGSSIPLTSCAPSGPRRASSA
jgi:cysteine desulfurase